MKSLAMEKIKEIIHEGTPAQKMELFGFNRETPIDKILLKFKIFTQANFARYFKSKSAPFHDEMVLNLIRSYLGEKYVNLAFRGSAKTTLAKLFVVFVILNDQDNFRKYIKVLSRDMKNPKQIVTDAYNMCLELFHIYGDVFEKEGERKTEERMDSFTLKSGVKLTAGTVGQQQRGHLQDASRPDWIWFDDVEDSESISSQTITEGIIRRSNEAIDGLSHNGSWFLTGNYISEYGVIEWFKTKSNVIVQITPIIIDGRPAWDVYTMEQIEAKKKDSEDFYGEYMCDPAKSEGKFFNMELIDRDIKACKEPEETRNEIKFWAKYLPNHRYGLGADTSEGIGKDSNALATFDFKTGELVATYHSNTISPDLFAYEISNVGRDFGHCIVGPENNNYSGGVVISKLKDIYPNIFQQVDNSKVGPEIQTKKLGWNTNSISKRNMFTDFRRDYNDGLIKIYDQNVLKEMRSYSNNDLVDKKGVGSVTRHFDLLTAVVIAWQMKDYAIDNQSFESYQTEGVGGFYPDLGI